MESKLPEVGASIFTVMSQLAAECNAINLSQGFPSFNPPKALLQRVDHYLRNGANQYAPMQGVPALGKALAAKTRTRYGRNVDADTEITVCAGATEGLFSAIQALVRPGDEVIVFDPAYDSYEPAVSLAGGNTRHIPLLSSADDGDFAIDWQRLQDTINRHTRLIIVNFPHNPTGANLRAGDLDRLADAVRDSDAYLLADEVYEHIVFDGAEHQSLLRHDELWQRSLVVSSFGKTYHATGWKVGYCIAPPALTAEFRKVHQFTCFSVVTPIQYALADYLSEHPEHFDELPSFYERKRDYFCRLLQASRFELQPAQGTFFQILDYSAISSAEDVAYARQLTLEIGIASIPISVFYAEPPQQHKLRFCFAKDDATLEEAAARLCRL
ncbi:MAG: pyridoxal phosphate-dependent aminotransferase [Gammaproteobacteria bacterium]|nr:MAG: pyridoxal phosphate-dependent aminotransferase [Gammaproteobacteria bacterium]